MALIDPETCSWCTEEVEDATLVMTMDGARICPICVNSDDGQKVLLANCRIKHSLYNDTERFF